jgi:hypothetical protein
MTARARRSPGTVHEAAYTDRALRLAAKRIPKIVYLPAALRGHNQYATLDNIQVRVTGPQIIDNHLRIQEADPLGLLIATSQGLPIPRFVVTDHVHGAECPADCRSTDPVVRIQYHTPSFQEQQDAARWLGARITFKQPGAYKRGAGQGARQHSEDYDAMIARAAAEGED